MHRHPVDRRAGRTAAAAGRARPGSGGEHRRATKGSRRPLHRRPVPAAHQHRPVVAELVQQPGHRPRGGGPPALDVQHERRAVRVRLEQLAQPEPRRGGRGELPAVPEERQRSRRLQVPDLQPAPVLVDVALDDVDAERVGRVQPRQRVARPVGDRQDASSRAARRAAARGAARATARPVADQHERDAGDDVDDVVVGRGDDGQRHQHRHQAADRPAAAGRWPR